MAPGGSDTPIIELGCGPGFLKEMYPDIVATDCVENPYADRVVDASALPFNDGEIAGLILLDTFHHLPSPTQFLHEAARALRPNGRVVMIEPWMGLLGKLLFTYVHHEECDLHVDPGSPWAAGHKDPMKGNAALPFLYFRPRGYLERLGLPLRVIERRAFPSLPWILTGGFQEFSLLPQALLPFVASVDRAISRTPRVTAARCFLAIEKVS
jgi:SAM-dependent methyltransferase